MAGDWIKMRVWLSRDPRVIAMADFLAREPRFLNGYGIGGISELRDARRNVTVALCVTGLLVTWGTAREQGDRENDDLVVAHCTLSTLDGMTGMPFFGAAMAHVEWAREREDGALVFPKFFKDNESPDDRHKRQNAERQARFRANRDNATVTDARNVTVTHREEKRREEPKPIVLRAAHATMPAGFEQFWNAYPATRRRVAKAKCLDVWRRLACEGEAAAIVAHVVAMAATQQWREGYEPAPLTYLNQRRWHDGLPMAAANEPRRVSL